jgi:uncharacterized protein DUF4387
MRRRSLHPMTAEAALFRRLKDGVDIFSRNQRILAKSDLASTIRSKNADVDHITFDIICRERRNFEVCATAARSAGPR